MAPSQPISLSIKNFGRLLSQTLRNWWADDAAGMGAALSFYSVLSLGPLLLIVISIAGLVFGQEAASGHLFHQIKGLVGMEGAEAIQTVIANSRREESGIWATIIGLVTLLLAASSFFGHLQSALNKIWKAEPPRHSNLWMMIQRRLFSFAMVLGIAFLLLISLVVSAGLSALGEFFSGRFPEFALQLVNVIISFSVITLLFAMIFKILPDKRVHWGDVWLGAMLTAALFTLGKQLIGLYLGHSALSSTYGAAGSLIVVLIWVYYSSQILFFGAEFAQASAAMREKAEE